MLDIWPTEVCACGVSFSSCLSSLGKAVGGQTLCRPQYRFFQTSLVWFCFYSSSKYFMKDSVIHSATLPFMVGSDAIHFKPRWCGEEIRDGSTQHLPPSQQWEPEPVCLTQGISLLHLIKRWTPLAHSHNLWRHSGISGENSDFHVSWIASQRCPFLSIDSAQSLG